MLPCERSLTGPSGVEGATSREHSQLLGAGNGKDMDAPLEAPEGTSPANTLTVASETHVGCLNYTAVR